MKKGKLSGFLRWLFIDPHPEIHEDHSATREAMNLAHCPPWPCKGANPRMCEACQQDRKPLEARHA